MKIYAKKSLGQNFLKSKEALRAIVATGDVQPTDTVLEVGPGKGVLTAELLKLAGKVIAVEKDQRLIESLKEKFKNEIESGKLEIVEQDILEYTADTIGKYKIIANIPYYITGAFLQKFLESDFQPSKMVLMLQKEVAKRIVAQDKKESILSISVKAYGMPKYIMTVKAKYFSPAPKVDSAVILIDKISKENFKNISESEFFKIVKAGFAHKRKMLVNNLKGLGAELPKDIDKKARAEELSLSDWLNLLKLI